MGTIRRIRAEGRTAPTLTVEAVYITCEPYTQECRLGAHTVELPVEGIQSLGLLLSQEVRPPEYP